ncbi:YaaC family protein [Oceanobacillus halophilus]|uniref:YaaC family protein n=1 Tax=Oceanobacillus halophilus TaxID=930130 RepID=A0A495A0P1_9BACI|nr:YaaC family protein [Oceanobacillus halophilus]RKQ32986.1 hypothetical protein D8M06_11355 [Oceanobacillus halophilus]
MNNNYDFYTYLTSQQTAQNYLFSCYKEISEVDAASKSYENYSAFMYYLEHGKSFYEIGDTVDLFAKPVLYFYGMTHLLKGCLLSRRPNYPESTTLLSHGVTSRKRKKKNYSFMEDDVKVQKKGLFPYFSSHLFNISNMPFEKVKMEDLLSVIPEIQSFFNLQQSRRMIAVGSMDSRFLKFPTELLDNYHLTNKAFIKRIEPNLPLIEDLDIDKEYIQLKIARNITSSNGPFFIHMKDRTIYFPYQRNHFLPISEVMIHYLLLYNLSMLCRYEAEWWGDLLSSKSDLDYPFIRKFLNITAEKIPQILQHELLSVGKL